MLVNTGPGVPRMVQRCQSAVFIVIKQTTTVGGGTESFERNTGKVHYMLMETYTALSPAVIAGMESLAILTLFIVL